MKSQPSEAERLSFLTAGMTIWVLKPFNISSKYRFRSPLVAYFITAGQNLIFSPLDAVRKIVSETYMLLKSKLPSTLQSLALYLANKDTEYILFKPVTVRFLCVTFSRKECWYTVSFL